MAKPQHTLKPLPNSTKLSNPQRYHAVLRHEDEVGAEVEPQSPPRRFPFPWSALARSGAGLAASALTTPLIFLIGGVSAQHFVPIALLITITGLVGAHFSYQLTRRELQSWVDRLKWRTHAIFSGTDRSLVGTPVDFGAFLEDLGQSLEWTLEQQLQHERNTIISTITSLISALEARDPSTRNHSSRVAKLSVRIGKEMGLGRAELYEVHLGGLLHDVGKIGIPDSILLKPQGLTLEEYEVMKSHSLLGARILAGIPGLERVAEIVLHHHEMYDGRGYPRGLAGKEIPLGARIIAVSDTYLSMTENRPYRSGQGLERIMREIGRVSGTQLDPDVTDTLRVLLKREVEAFGAPLSGGFPQEERKPDPPRRAA